MNPFFSIITPTLQRESLGACCASVDAQSFSYWEHIIVADSSQENFVLGDWHQLRDQRRLLMRSPRVTRQWGNFQRHLAWEWATGEYLIYLDDDNVMAHPQALMDIYEALKYDNFPRWALFPIQRHSSFFLLLPPGMCQTDTANIVVKRAIGRWHDTEAREADGQLAERLKAGFEYSTFPAIMPIIVMDKSSGGV